MTINDEQLKELEDEAIYVFREVAAQFEKKVILFSGGKDSIVLVHLAKKAFHPARMPFSLMHIDTGHNFEETLKFDVLVERCLLVELKAVQEIHPVHKAQLLSYMKLLNVPLGLLLNFHEERLVDGVTRMILPGANRNADSPPP